MTEEKTENEAVYESVAIIGSGTIATGLAVVSTLAGGRVVLMARSPESAERAAREISRLAERLPNADPESVSVSTDPTDAAGVDLLVEAVAEDLDLKAGILEQAGELAPDADVATTTSSLPIGELGSRSGLPDRLFGLHVFNPVTGMELVELCVPEGTDPGVAERASSWCMAIGKTPVEVPDIPGFVVNRLLFPYLFEAVRLVEATGMEPEEVDRCMKLGLGHPMGPLAILDLVGLDVAVAIGEVLNRDTGDPNHLAPEAVTGRVSRGDLGRKSGRGFFEY